jgi:GT2 family glycosyltransferase
MTSILIATYKRLNLLKLALESLSNQVGIDQCEVLVLDDSSELTDGKDINTLCQSFQSRLKMRYIPTGRTKIDPAGWRIPGFAQNIGAKLANGDNLILSGCDVFLLDDTIIQNILR